MAKSNPTLSQVPNVKYVKGLPPSLLFPLCTQTQEGLATSSKEGARAYLQQTRKKKKKLTDVPTYGIFLMI